MADATVQVTPSAYLSGLIGKPVTVRLNSGISYLGDLLAFDARHNVALSKATEVSTSGNSLTLGDTFVTGGDVFFISAR